MVRVLFILTALVLLLLSATCSAANLEVTVRGLSSNVGNVHIALFNKPDHFPYHEGIYREEKTSILENRAKLVFDNLSPGDYGVAVYHDENTNDEFDQGFLGIPLEDYGFSNDAPVFFGPPSFGAAKFLVTEPQTRIEIDLGG